MSRRPLSPERFNARYVLTPWGWGWLLASPRGLWAFSWPWGSREEAAADLEHALKDAPCGPGFEKDRVLEQAAEALLAFFQGFPQQLQEVPLDAGRFTPWQRRVYGVVRAIPPGETRSYGRVAEECGRPGGARAVGQALAANPLPLFIPCHRVVYGDGRLGGYGCGGPDLKECLLSLERRGRG